MNLFRLKDGNHRNQKFNGSALLLVVLVLAGFALLPRAQAVGPDTDGNIPGSNNGEGIGVLMSRTTGVWNTGTGRESLNHLTSGNQNTATGLRALFSDTTGGFNTATGVYSLYSNTSGFYNSATGAYSLVHNTAGDANTANGYQALFSNTGGDHNTASGLAALYLNRSGLYNTANGSQALYSNTNGFNNTAIGVFALYSNTSGYLNTALGSGAGANLTTNNYNVCIGAGVGGVAGEGHTIRIGDPAHVDRCYIAGIHGATATNGLAVFVDMNGKLGTVTSSARFKDDIKPTDKASESIFALKPVTFRYKKQIDAKGTPQFGLVAEDVAKVNPDLVILDREGKPYSVRYEAVNAMLLNEFLKEHRKVQELEANAARQQKQVDALTAGLQKVSAQLEASKPAPQVAINRP